MIKLSIQFLKNKKKMLREFFVRHINQKNKLGLYKKPIKAHYINPIPLKSHSSPKRKLDNNLKNNPKQLTITKYQNCGIKNVSNKNFRHYKIDSIMNSKTSLKTHTNTSNYFLTSSNNFIDKNFTQGNENGKNKSSLIKTKISLQKQIIKLKNEKFNLLKNKIKNDEAVREIQKLENDIKKFDLLINKCKKDYNDLNNQYSNLKNQIEYITQNNNN